MRTRLHAFRRQLGVRGLGLLLIAFAWSLIGLGVYQDQSATPTGAPHLLIHADIRAGLWIGSGMLAAALSTSRRWDWVALTIAVIMPTVRVASYGWAWITYLAPGGEPGYPGGWYNAAIHSVLVAFVVLVACIIDVPTPQQVTDRGENA